VTQEKISELREAVSQAGSLYKERRKYLRFVTHQGLTAREALEKIGDTARSALSKAKSFLAKSLRDRLLAPHLVYPSHGLLDKVSYEINVVCDNSSWIFLARSSGSMIFAPIRWSSLVRE